MVNHAHSHAHDSAKDIGIAFFLNLFFTVFEILGGLWTNSVAILSDALHDLSDSFSLGLSWYLERYSRRGKDKVFSYGYSRFSLLAAFINAVVLIGGSLLILSVAVPRLVHPEHSHAPGMVLFALVGIAANGLAALRLRKGRTLNVRVVLWHLLEDILGWVAVLVVGLTLMVKDIPILDPLLSVLITLYVLYNVIRNFRKTFALFLQAVPEDVDLERVEGRLRSLDKVVSVHHTSVWSLDGVHHVLTTHVVVPGDATKGDILNLKSDIRSLTESLDFTHTTVEFEYEEEVCRMDRQRSPEDSHCPP
ncbi:MAG TPA: cation diffusion facilitator family transporter [Dissulfurispiraceae bacterium]|nr:cation diffusion facilitator family transporter [Dissulfurispiraceae bacterium]